jgi:hypothetical protein
MRFPIVPGWALAGLVTLALGCSVDDGPAEPAANPVAVAAQVTDAGALALFGLGASPEAGAACRSGPYRQFDFWLGTWQVSVNGGPPASASMITGALDGCAVLEHWHGAGGGEGRSLNVYDRADGRWHQHWVENSGFYPLRLDGGLVHGEMVMQGSYPDPVGSGKVFTSRYSWSRLPNHDVRQAVQQSLDGGATFGPVTFDGRYHLNPSPAIPAARFFGFCTSTDPGLALFQEFRFTVGSWDVSLVRPDDAEGEASRRARLRSDITTDLEGCLTEERLTGPGGYEARVFLNIRPLDEIWQRTYVDNRGLRVYVTGPRLQQGQTVLKGTMPGANGQPRAVRVAIEQLDADTFVERWATADPSGEWHPLVTARYRRR